MEKWRGREEEENSLQLEDGWWHARRKESSHHGAPCLPVYLLLYPAPADLPRLACACSLSRQREKTAYKIDPDVLSLTVYKRLFVYMCLSVFMQSTRTVFFSLSVFMIACVYISICMWTVYKIFSQSVHIWLCVCVCISVRKQFFSLYVHMIAFINVS